MVDWSESQYSRGLRDRDILWKKLPGVSNVPAIPSWYAVFVDFIMALYNTVRKDMQVPCSGQDVSEQDLRRPQVVPELQSCASRVWCQMGYHFRLLRLTGPSTNRKAHGIGHHYSLVGPRMKSFLYDSPLTITSQLLVSDEHFQSENRIAEHMRLIYTCLMEHP